jgi:hypothetical protein
MCLQPLWSHLRSHFVLHFSDGTGIPPPSTVIMGNLHTRELQSQRRFGPLRDWMPPTPHALMDASKPVLGSAFCLCGLINAEYGLYLCRLTPGWT